MENPPNVGSGTPVLLTPSPDMNGYVVQHFQCTNRYIVQHSQSVYKQVHRAASPVYKQVHRAAFPVYKEVHRAPFPVYKQVHRAGSISSVHLKQLHRVVQASTYARQSLTDAQAHTLACHVSALTHRLHRRHRYSHTHTHTLTHTH